MISIISPIFGMDFTALRLWISVKCSRKAKLNCREFDFESGIQEGSKYESMFGPCPSHEVYRMFRERSVQ